MMKLFFITLAFLSLTHFESFSQQSSWKSFQDGWVMRKAPQSNKYEKFFAIGLWNVPSYNLEAMEDNPVGYRKSAKRYLDSTSLYNLVYMSPGTDPDKQGRIEVTGTIGFYNLLKEYQESIPGITKETDRAYNVRQYMKAHVEDDTFVQTLDKTIDNLITANGPVDHIWAPIDEIVNGGAGSGWCWHPEIGEKIKERINAKEKNTLVFTDLVGIARGNSFLFEQNYLKSHSAMPANPPYEALGADAIVMPNRPLLGFVQSYDQKPVYVNGTADYTNYDLPTLKDLFYENLKICAKAYKGCGDVFGINAFIDCNTYPVLAGVTVDGIKAGLGKDAPVWLFFDGNGYAKPSDMSAFEFVQNLKCQIYTAIIHGATGILFWNDRSLSPDVFYALESVIKELTDNLNIFYLPTVKSKWNNDLHYMIKKDKNTKYIIVSNSSTSESIKLNLPNVNKESLKPLEVFIQKL